MISVLEREIGALIGGLKMAILACALLQAGAAVSYTGHCCAEDRPLEQWPHFHPDDPILADPDRMPVPVPEYRVTSQYYDFIENTFFKVGLDKNPGALNVNTLGEVPNSSWFTNRHGMERMPPADLVRGAKSGEGPDVESSWTIVEAKGEGITPGFTVVDSRGDTYFVKTDPVDHPHLATSAEAICTPLFHAIGYNVPENYLVDVQVSNLRIGDEATMKAKGDRERGMTQEDLRAVLSKAPVRPDGTLRVIASKAIPGKGLFDHFRYYGTRPDDANDITPHQLRRELRGLRIFAAWLNHDDARSINTLDVYVKESYVRHYLLDFGSCLGSGSVKPQTRRAGHEYMWDPVPTLKTVAGLGLWVRPYLKIEFPRYPGVGRFESEAFKPERWKPEYPNPAFVLMDENDAFWAAGIVMRFTDEEIRAVVERGGLGDLESTKYMIATLIERRDKIGRHYLNQVNPLGDFNVDESALTFNNLSVEHGFGESPRGYEVTWRSYDNREREPKEVIGSREVIATAIVPGGPACRVAAAFPRAVSGREEFIFAEIVPTPDAPDKWREPVRVFLKNLKPGWEIVGIRR